MNIQEETTRKIELIEMLKSAGIVKTRGEDEKSFILNSGQLSKLFLDIKEASLNPKILKEIIRMIEYITTKGEICDINFGMVGSIALGSVPIGAVYSYVTGTPHIIVRSEKHSTGTETKIIGNCRGKYVLLVEDVSTTGENIVNAVKAIRAANGLCHECVVVIDREEGAAELCKQNQIDLYPILTKSHFGIKE